MAATELFDRLPPPAEIENLPQFMEQRRSLDAGPAAAIADPTPMLREALDRLRVMHERLAALRRFGLRAIVTAPSCGNRLPTSVRWRASTVICTRRRSNPVSPILTP